jgi:hypothetical protein
LEVEQLPVSEPVKPSQEATVVAQAAGAVGDDTTSDEAVVKVLDEELGVVVGVCIELRRDSTKVEVLLDSA